MNPAPRDLRDTLLAGVDGGQTSTTAVLARGDGSVLARGSGPACDHLNVPGGRERNRVAIQTALRDACAAAGVSPDQLDAVGLGLTSAQRELNPAPAFREMVREIAPSATVWVDIDVVTNLAGASAGAPGIVMIAGGGSVAYGVDAGGGEAFSGGLGYLMGDEGSGWAIGLEALRAAARSADGRGPETALLPMVLDTWKLATIREVVRVIYREDFARHEVAALSPSVLGIAETGDAVAAGIVAGAATDLANLALGVANQLHAPGDSIDVFPTGGVFNAEELILAPFRREVIDRWPAARVRPARFAPVVGALIRAARELGLAADDAFLDRIAVTSGE